MRFVFLVLCNTGTLSSAVYNASRVDLMRELVLLGLQGVLHSSYKAQAAVACRRPDADLEEAKVRLGMCSCTDRSGQKSDEEGFNLGTVGDYCRRRQLGQLSCLGPSLRAVAPLYTPAGLHLRALDLPGALPGRARCAR